MGRIEYSDAPALSEALQRNILELTNFNETVPNPELIVASDVEGPLVLGDTALEIMSEFVRPENAKDDSPDYGAIIYGATYEWYTKRTLGLRKTNWHLNKKGKMTLNENNYPATAEYRLAYAQEGTDIALALAPLLAKGVTKKDIVTAAERAQPTPGSDEWIKYVKENNGLIVGVTTAWQPVADVVKEKVGIDAAIGTPFPIDEARRYLKREGKLEEETKLVNEFLNDCFDIIDYIDDMGKAGNKNEKLKWEEELKARIGWFYEKELGVSFSGTERKIRKDEEQTLLGQIIESIGVVGDRSKAAIALALFRSNKGEDTITTTVGDGSNDCVMLDRAGELSEEELAVGINGTRAVQAAKIGVITEDVEVLKHLVEIQRKNRDIDIRDLIKKANSEVRSKAIIHEGGALGEVSTDLLTQHEILKKMLRGQAGAADLNV